MMRVILDTKAVVQRFYKEPIPLTIEEVLEGIFWIIQDVHGQQQRLDNFIETLNKEWTIEERELLPSFRQIVWHACEQIQRSCEQSALYQNGTLLYSFDSLHRDDVVVIHNHYRGTQKTLFEGGQRESISY